MESFTREEQVSGLLDPHQPVCCALSSKLLLQRFVLAEMIKSSTIDIDNLIHFIRANTVSPDWMTMQLPQGEFGEAQPTIAQY